MLRFRFWAFVALLPILVLPPSGSAQALVNGDFAQGLQGWTARGEAFSEAALRGPAPGSVTCRDMNKSKAGPPEGMTGRWISSEDTRGRYQITGTLDSQAFVVNAPHLRFWYGEYNQGCAVELHVDGRIVHTTAAYPRYVGLYPNDDSNLRWYEGTWCYVEWDLQPFRGKKAFLRIRDGSRQSWIAVAGFAFLEKPERSTALAETFFGGSSSGWTRDGAAPSTVLMERGRSGQRISEAQTSEFAVPHAIEGWGMGSQWVFEDREKRDGTLLSPEFTVDRRWLTWWACVSNGTLALRVKAGAETLAEYVETKAIWQWMPRRIDLEKFKGRKVRIEVVGKESERGAAFWNLAGLFLSEESGPAFFGLGLENLEKAPAVESAASLSATTEADSWYRLPFKVGEQPRFTLQADVPRGYQIFAQVFGGGMRHRESTVLRNKTPRRFDKLKIEGAWLRLRGKRTYNRAPALPGGKLQVTLGNEPLPDPSEVDEELNAGALLLPLEKEGRCCIFPRGDNDAFAIEIPSPGIGTLSVRATAVTSPVDLLLRLEDERRQIAYVQGNKGADVLLRTDIREGGRYQLLLSDGSQGRHWDANADFSETPLTVVATFESVDDVHEPNGSFEEAASIALGQEARGALFPERDEDWFVVDVPAPGLGFLRVQLEKVPTALRPYLDVFDPDRRHLRWRSGDEGESLRCEIPISRAGRYYIKLRDQRGGSSPRAYALRPSFEALTHHAEPNGSIETARTLQLDVKQQETIFPRGDEDFFAVAIPAPGRGRMVVQLENGPEHVDLQLALWRPGKKWVGEWNLPEGRPGHLTFTTHEGGVHILRVRDGDSPSKAWGDVNQEWSSRPYEITARWTEATDEHEPNETIKAARPIVAGTDVVGRIWPVGDQDWYSFEAKRGQDLLLELSTQSPVTPCFQLHRSDGAYVFAAEALPHLPLRRRFHVDRDGTWTLLVRDGDNGWQPYNDANGQEGLEPYRLKVTLTDSCDLGRKDDTAETAHPLPLGEELTGTILPVGDQDWFRVEVPQDGLLAMQLHCDSASIAPQIQLFDGTKKYLGSEAFSGGGMAAVSRRVSKGSYLVLVHDGDGSRISYNDTNGQSSPEPYHLKVWMVEPGKSVPSNVDEGRALALKEGANPPAWIDRPGRELWYRYVAPGEGLAKFYVSAVDDGLNPVLERHGVPGAEKPQVVSRVGPGRWEWIHASMQAGETLLLRLRDIDPSKHSDRPMAIDLVFDARPREGEEPNEGPEQSRSIALGKAVDGTLWKKGDEDWFEWELPAAGKWKIDLSRVADDIDPEAWLYERRADGKRPRVLYLRGDDEARFHEELDGTYGVEVTSLRKVEGKAAEILKDGTALAGFDLVILDHLSAFEDFGLADPATEKTLLDWVARGGHFVLLAPLVSDDLLAGAKLVSCDSTWSGAWTADHLVARSFATDNAWSTGWCSAAGAKAATIVFDMGQSQRPDRVVFRAGGQDKARMARNVTLSFSEKADGGFREVWKGSLSQDPWPQSFSLSGASGRYVQLKVLDNHGHPNEIQLNEMALYQGRQGRLFGLRFEDCAEEWNHSPGSRIQVLDGTPEAYRLTEGRTLTVDGPWDLTGWLASWKDAGFRAYWVDVTAAESLASLVEKTHGKGRITATMANFGTAHQRERKRWFLEALCDLPLRFQAQWARQDTHSFGNELHQRGLSEGPVRQILRLRDRVGLDAKARPYRLEVGFEALPVEGKNDSLAEARPLKAGQVVSGAILPDDDADWYLLPMEESRKLRIRLHDVPDHQNLAMDLYRVEGKARVRPRILYLVGGRTDYVIDKHFPELDFHRVKFDDFAARTILDHLADYDGVILDGLTDWDQFAIGDPATQAKIERYVTAGGIFLLSSPSLTGSFVAAANGGRVVSVSSVSNDRVPGEHLIDGRGRRWPQEDRWESKDKVPQHVVLELGGTTAQTVDRIVLSQAVDTGLHAREVEIFSGTGADGPWTSRGRFELPKERLCNVMSPKPFSTRFLKVLVHSVQGDPNRVSLSEIEVYGPTNLHPLFGLRVEGVWDDSDDAVQSLSPPHPASHRWEPGPPLGGWSACEFFTGFRDWKQAGFEALQMRKDVEGQAVTLLKRMGKGEVLLDGQELGWRDGLNQGHVLRKLRNHLAPLLNRRRRVWIDHSQYANEGGIEEAMLVARKGELLGLKVLRVGGWAGMVTPYRLWVEEQPVKLFAEPDDEREKATTLASGVAAQGNLFPLEDRDWYHVPLSSTGRLELRLGGVADILDPQLFVYHGKDAEKPFLTVNGSENGTRGAGESVTLEVTGPVDYHIEVSDVGGGQCLEPYEFLARFVEVVRPLENNDLPERAVPVAPREAIAANLYPAGDVDWYALDLAKAGTVKVELTDVAKTIDPVVEVHRKKGEGFERVARFDQTQQKQLGGDEVFSFEAPDAGEYFLRIWDENGERRTEDLYQLTADYEAAPDRRGPSVLQSFPADGAGNVATMTEIAIYLDEAIDPASFRPEGAVELRGRESGAVKGSCSWDEASRRLSFQPAEELFPDDHLSLRLSSALRDRAGNAIRWGGISFDTVSAASMGPVEPARIVLRAGSPVGLGTVEFRLDAGARLRKAPELIVITPSGRRETVSDLSSTDKRIWTGRFPVRRDFGEGPARFALKGEASGRRVVDRIAEGESFDVDVTAPGRASGLVARSLPKGEVNLQWAVTRDADAAGYAILRSKGGAIDPQGASVKTLEGAGNNFTVDLPPEDGEYLYAVACLDRAGNRGPPSPSVVCMSDRTPPSAIVEELAVKQNDRGQLSVTWKDAPDPDHAAYWLYMSDDRREPAADPWKKIQVLPMGTTEFVQHHRWDGRFRYAVAIADATGNPGKACPFVEALQDTRAPWVKLQLDPPAGPYAKGQVRVRIEANEVLKETPLFGWRAAGEKQARTVSLVPDGKDPKVFTGVVTVDGTEPDGKGQFFIRSIDPTGNVGTGMDHSEFLVDTAPPRASVKAEVTGTQGERQLVLDVKVHEPVVKRPELWIDVETLTGKRRWDFVVEGDPKAGQSFVARLQVERGGKVLVADGMGSISIKAEDRFAHVGGSVVQGASYRVDLTPPDPPGRFAVKSRPGRKLHLEWLPPTNEAVTAYRVFRSADEACSPVKANLRKDGLRDTRWEDSLDAEAKVWYRVAAIDPAGNEGKPSQAVVGMADSTPPPPPEALTYEVEKAGQIRLAWQKPRLEAVDLYRVHRRAIVDGKTLDPVMVLETRECSAVDLPKLTGRLVYEVGSVDEAGNESKGTATEAFDYDVRPAVATLEAQPSFGHRTIWIPGFMSMHMRDLGEVIREGKTKLVLSFDEAVKDGVRLSYRTEVDDVPVDLLLERRDAKSFVATLDLPAPSKDLDVSFVLRAEDTAGNLTTTIAKESHFLLDGEAPPALSVCSVSPRPGGKVHLAWSPPGGEPGGEPRYRIYRAARSFTALDQATLVADDLKKTEHEDLPPRDGTWYYAVVALDRAGHVGGLMPPELVRSSRVGPKAPSGVAVKLGRDLAFNWEAPAGDEKVSYRVYGAAEPLKSVAQLSGLQPMVHDLDRSSWHVQPERPEKLWYSVVAVDEAGNLGTPSSPLLVDLRSKMPSVRIRTHPASPVRSAVRIELESSLALVEVPSLTLQPANRKPLSVALVAKDSTRRIWLGSFDVTEDTGDGEARFAFRGQGAEGLPGGFIEEGERLLIDTRAPTASLRFSPRTPLTSGPVDLTLLPSEPLSEAPVLSYTPQGGKASTVALVAGEERGTVVWVGRTVIPGGLPDGLASLRFRGKDRAGNEGTRITPDRFAIDTHPPKAPGQLALSSRRGGGIRLHWRPPVYLASEGNERIAAYVAYRSDKPFEKAEEGQRLHESTRLEAYDTPPHDGLWFYRVATRDAAGLESPLGPLASCLSDRTPPPVPRPAQPTVTSTGIVVAWESVEALGASTSDRFEVLAEWTEPGARWPTKEVVYGPGPALVCNHRPLRGGDYLYRVRSLDVLDHASPWSSPVFVRYDKAEPVASLSFDPKPPFSGGKIGVKLESTKELEGRPDLSWTSVLRPTGDSIEAARRATMPVERHAIALTGTGRFWEGSFEMAADPQAEAVAFTWKGTSQVRGRSVVGVDLVEGARASVDFGGPVASIQFDASVPRQDRRVMLKAGTYTFTVKVSEPLAEAPRMQFVPRGKDPLPVGVAPKDDLHWMGSIRIDEGFGDGSGSFTFEGKDLSGNLGREIAAGANVRVDTTAPSRIRKIRATAYPGGKVRIDWIPPFGKDRQPEKEANRFYVYRSTREIVDASGLEPMQIVDRVLGAFDHPKGSRRYYYAVLAVDDAGNAGPLSAAASVEIDKDPPSPPQAVTALLTENNVVKVSWERGGGEKPLLYNVYLEKHPITTTRGLSPNARGVPFTHMYGAPNEDGRYYFAVTAIDDALNESEPSASVAVDYRKTLPIASFKIEPDIWLKDGSYSVTLETSKSLIEPPVVEVNQESGQRFRLPFTGAGARWTSQLHITEAVAEGTCGFVYRGRSEGGIVGNEIKRGPLFHVDRTATLPPGNLEIRPDDERTPGAVKLTWNSPKSKDRATEVPHFYRIYRDAKAITDVRNRAPIHELVVEYENMDEYVSHDVPPENGTWHYVVTALDMARNESLPSNDFAVLSSTTTPRFRLGLFTDLGGAAPTEKVGRTPATVRVNSSQGLKTLDLAWFPWTREERLGEKKEKRHVLTLRPEDEERRVWVGELAIEGDYAEEQEAHFEVKGTGRDGAVGSFLSTGKTFYIDTVGPEARIKIPSIYTMRVDAYANKLVVAPVKTGRIDVTLETPEELTQPPRVSWTSEGGDWVPLPMRGFGSFWKGAMDIRPDTPNVESKFRYRGMDRAGNESETIEKRMYDRRVDETVDPPRTLENFATTGGVFDVDTVPPSAPSGLELDQRKLGVAVIKWKEPAGEPKTYRLYRSLTPLASRVGQRPVKDKIYAPVIVDDPPCDGNYFYAVTALDMAGNESGLSECKSVFIDSIKPELKITPVPSGDDFVILMDENPPPGMTLELRFPGGKTMNVELGGSSGQLKEVHVPGSRRKARGLVLPQLLEVFNGTVEVVVHSPDPAGNVVEKITKIEAKKIDVATGGEVQSFDNLVKLELPPGVEPVVPKGPGEVRRVGGYENLFFIRYENIPKASDTPREEDPGDPKEPDPLPPGLEVVGKPYRIELNADTEEPMELSNSASQADLSALTELTAKLRMTIPTMHSEVVEDVDYLKTRLKVVKWVPMTSDEARGRVKGSKRGRWAIVDDVEIDKSTGELIVPAKEVTTYVIVAERTPPSIVDLLPPSEGTVKTFRPAIGARIVDKGTGVAVGAENRITLHVDGMPVPSDRVTLSDEDPTEVTVNYTPAEDLTPGSHMVTLKAQDVVENESVLSWKFFIDNEPPQILAVGPKEGSRIGVGRPALTAKLADEGGGIDPERISLTLDGKLLVDAPFDSVAGRLVAHPPEALPSGEHRAELVIEDRGGKKAVQRWTFVTDREPPTVELLDPPAGKALGRRKAPLVVDLRDAFGNVDPTSVVVDVDGRLVPRRFADKAEQGYDYDTVTGRLHYAPSEGWEPGPHRLFVAAADAHGHLTARAFPFQVDVTPPAVVVLAAESKPLAAFGAYLLRIEEEDVKPVIEGPGRLVFDVLTRHLLIEPGTASATVTLTVRDGAGFVSANAVNLAEGTVDRSVEQVERKLPPPPIQKGQAGGGKGPSSLGAALGFIGEFFDTPPGPLSFPQRLVVALKIALVSGLLALVLRAGRHFFERRSSR